MHCMYHSKSRWDKFHNNGQVQINIAYLYTAYLYAIFTSLNIFLLEMTSKGIFFNHSGQAVGSTTEMCPKELTFL